MPDDIAAIAKEVAALSSSCQAVITSGGVGPTLDDVTMEGIAAAFGVDVIRWVTQPLHRSLAGKAPMLI